MPQLSTQHLHHNLCTFALTQSTLLRKNILSNTSPLSTPISTPLCTSASAPPTNMQLCTPCSAHATAAPAHQSPPLCWTSAWPSKHLLVSTSAPAPCTSVSLQLCTLSAPLHPAPGAPGPVHHLRTCAPRPTSAAPVHLCNSAAPLHLYTNSATASPMHLHLLHLCTSAPAHLHLLWTYCFTLALHLHKHLLQNHLSFTTESESIYFFDMVWEIFDIA